MPSRPRRKTSKKTKVKARAQAPRSARKKSKPASKRSGTSASRSSPSSRVKSGKPAPKRRAKQAVARKRPAVAALPKPPRQGNKRESDKTDAVYHVTVEEIEVIPAPENDLQTDLWQPKP